MSKSNVRIIGDWFQTERGEKILRAARGDMSVEEVFAMTPEELELVRTFLVFVGRVKEDVANHGNA